MQPIVTITNDEIIKLLELAGEAIYLQETEFSNYATEEEIKLLEHVHGLLGMEIPSHVASSLECAKLRIKPPANP